MAISATFYLFACALLVGSDHVRRSHAVLQAKVPADQSVRNVNISHSPFGELKTADVKLKDFYSRSKGSKRYHEIDKDKQSGESSSRLGKFGSNLHGKISYEIKVFIPKHELTSMEMAAPDRTVSSEIAPARFEAPMEASSSQAMFEERVPFYSGYAQKHEPQRASSALRPEYGDGKNPYEKAAFFVPVFSEEIAPHDRPSQARPYYSDPELKTRFHEPYLFSSEGRNSEEAARGVTYVEVKNVKVGEPAYPPSYKQKMPRYSSSAELPISFENREAYRTLETAPDYIPYDQQQTTDPPVSTAKDSVYYEKPPPEPVVYEQRSRPAYRGPDYGGRGGGYYQPPPPPMPHYEPSYYYVYPQQSYGPPPPPPPPQYGQGGQYKQQPRPLYSGYGYAAYAPYRRR